MGAALRVTAGSVCGSDLRPYRGAGKVDHAATGHDYLGEVVKLGKVDEAALVAIEALEEHLQ